MPGGEPGRRRRQVIKTSIPKTAVGVQWKNVWLEVIGEVHFDEIKGHEYFEEYGIFHEGYDIFDLIADADCVGIVELAEAQLRKDGRIR